MNAGVYNEPLATIILSILEEHKTLEDDDLDDEVYRVYKTAREPFPRREDWDATIDHLIAAGLLKRRRSSWDGIYVFKFVTPPRNEAVDAQKTLFAEGEA